MQSDNGENKWWYHMRSGENNRPKRHVTQKLPSLAICTALLTVLIAAGAVAEDPDLWVPTARLIHVNDTPVKSGYFCLVGTNPFCGNARSDFGSSVAVDGDISVVGNPHAEAVHIYQRSNAVWVETQTFSGPPGFGLAVAISGGTIIVGGASGSDVPVYEYRENRWEETGVLAVSENGCLGRSLDVQGDRVVLGDPCTSRIHVFDKVDGSWTGEPTWTLEGVPWLGRSVALDGDRIAAASTEGAFLFERTGPGWSSTSIHPGSTTLVDLSGETFVLATHGLLREVFVFGRSSDGWTHTATLTGEDASAFEASERFASALALRGDTLVVGAERDDPSPGSPDVEDSMSDLCDHPAGINVCVPPRPGAVYVYDGSNGLWSQTAKLVGDSIGEPNFGASVAISPDEGHLVVGAPYKLMSSVAGVMDVDPEDSVHIFTRGV